MLTSPGPVASKRRLRPEADGGSAETAAPDVAGLRVALVTYGLGPGGAERVVSTMANFWSSAGAEVALITFCDARNDFYSLAPAVRRIGLARRRSLLPGALGRLRLLRRTLREVRPDVVISFIDTVNLHVLVAAQGLGVPVVVSERTDPTQHRIGAVPTLIRRLVYPRAAAVVVQSDTVRDWARRFLPAERVHVIANPLSPLLLEAVPEPVAAHAPGAGSPTIVAVGRLGREKGFDLLLRAFALVRPRHPAWSLQIVGEGEERGDMEALARSLGIDDAVSFPGLCREVGAVLRAAGIFVLSSRFEGFPNALLEAMACGLPVVAADCPSGPRHIVRDGVNGILVEPENVEALAVAISRLIADPAARFRLAAAAVEVRSRFSLGRVMQQWESLVAAVVRP